MEVTSIIKKSKNAKKILSDIRHKEECVVIFVDLCGSTEFKDNNPDELVWLSRLAIFLQNVSDIINVKGRVIKYIGDEVMGIFQGNSALECAFHACEDILSFIKNSEDNYQVKIAVEFGDVSFITFGNRSSNKNKKLLIPSDPNGITVDKCARLMQKAKPNTVLCSDGFFNSYSDKSRWRSCGTFNAKGIKRKIRVYQLKTNIVSSPPIIVKKNDMNIEDALKRINSLENLVKELKELHHS